MQALAAAATQTGGLTASFGTMAKPFHAGKAAIDGILAAGLAAGGFVGATGLFQPGGGLDNALVQDRAVALAPVDFAGWRILDNSFKPLCRLSSDAPGDRRRSFPLPVDPGSGRYLRRGAEVGALADHITGGKSGTPATPLEGKFDLKYFVALGLHGRDLFAADFREPWHPDPEICATAGKVRIAVSPEMGFAAARWRSIWRMAASLLSMCRLPRATPATRLAGTICAPNSTRSSLRLGPRAEALFGLVREFGRPGTLDEMRAILARL